MRSIARTGAWVPDWNPEILSGAQATEPPGGGTDVYLRYSSMIEDWRVAMSAALAAAGD